MKKVNFHTKIIIGLLLGVLTGFLLNFAGGVNNTILSEWVFPFLGFIGSLFIRLIQMSVVPLVFFSIAEGVANLGNVSKLKSIGVKTFLYIIITGTISAGLGVALGAIFKPGVGADIGSGSSVENLVQETPSGYNIILEFIPLNPFEALSNASMMQVIAFSVFCGVGMLMIGDKGEPIKKAFSYLASLISQIVNIVLLTTPYGAFALMSSTIGKFGGNVVGPLLKFFALDWLAMIIIQVIIFSFILLILAKVSPIKFWKRAIEPWIITFTTGSSNAALPVNMKLAPEMGVPKEISSFVLPIGATANMNGICAFLGLLSVFAVQMYGIEQTLPLLLYIVFQCVVLAIGTAAVPQGGIIMATVLFTALGFPLEIVGIVAGAYKIVDGIHTTSNSVGDLVISVAVASHENVLDKEKYNIIKPKLVS